MPSQNSPRPLRTFNPRRGRMSPTAHQRLSRVDDFAVPPGPVDLAALFGRVAPLMVEIGCGYGQSAAAYASTYPDHDVIAVDVHSPGIAGLVGRIDDGELTNLRVLIDDGLDLLRDRMPEASIDALHLFFPDPWPKRGHHKRRIVSADNLDLFASRLAPDGLIRFATDWDDYAEWARRRFTDHPRFELVPTQRPSWRPPDGYETKGRAAGRTITELCARLVSH